MSSRGHTLVELLVVLAMLGVVGGVAVMAFRPATASHEPGHPGAAEARRRALTTGRPVTFSLDPDQAALATALPDGRVVADSSTRLDPFTGRFRAAR